MPTWGTVAEKYAGERVFQLWNVCTVAKGFVERSWVADTLSAADIERIRAAVAERARCRRNWASTSGGCESVMRVV